MITPEKADALAWRAHGATRNRSGVPFIDHVRSVAARVSSNPDPYAVPAALLHDTVEKADMSFEDLRAAGADERLLALVDALTERPGESEESYLTRAVSDPLSLRIKRADISDKLRLGSSSVLGGSDRQLIEERARRRLARLEAVAAQRRPHPNECDPLGR